MNGILFQTMASGLAAGLVWWALAAVNLPSLAQRPAEMALWGRVIVAAPLLGGLCPWIIALLRRRGWGRRATLLAVLALFTIGVPLLMFPRTDAAASLGPRAIFFGLLYSALITLPIVAMIAVITRDRSS